MAYDLYTMSTGDAVEMVSKLLSRGDVRQIRIEDIDGEPLVTVPGTSEPEAGAREVMEGWQEFIGGGAEVRLVAETGLPAETPTRSVILEEPPEYPDEGEPRRG